MIPGQTFLNSDDGGDSSGNGGSEFETLAFFAGQVEQFGPAMSNQEFVCGDHRLARSQRFPNPFAGRLDASNQLHKNVGVRGKQFVDALRPAHAGGNPIHFFPGHFAIENVGQLKGIVRFLTE